MELFKVTVKLSLAEVLEFKKKYTKKIINSLPFKIEVSTTSLYMPENTYKAMLNSLNKR